MPKKNPKTCLRCGERPAVIRFCNPCAREISAAHDNVFPRAVAARAFINQATRVKGFELRRLEVAAAVSIFFPEVGAARTAKILQAVRREPGE